ncbi:Retrovirus-related Pol polyprotein from transposon TNT 1-94 [Vitis vinifera]|uniref:Retrovirus-related Pol polyprotein from transposon TNT 1-94 n=1 Tax=Vitis vinifera TaxID=29760 RepID=A0A438CHD0_VITVI|nr:Retrovirus-related Pol polyprotein from transposon TNT 1-94 [Vitis vinifera]
MTLGMTRKTMRNRGFKPWIFRSCLGYHHFVINDNNCDQQKKDSKKTSTTTVAEIKTEANVADKASALVAAIDYGGRSITFVAYLINRIPSNSVDFQTSLQALTNVVIAPTVTNLPPRVFGCVTFVHLHKHQHTKLTFRALQCVFVGYALHKKGYRCYHPPTQRMFITMDMVFHEDSMYFSSESELQGEYHKEIQTLDYNYHISKEDESRQSELVNQEASELDMSGTTLEPSSNDHPKAEEVIKEGKDSTIKPSKQFGFEDAFIEIPNQSSSAKGVLNLEPDPLMKQLPHCHNRGSPKPTYEPELSTKVKYPMSNYEALADPRWKAAMNEEMKSLHKNETWELVECPLGNKPVGCRWIYTVKYKADGSIERFKARLVAKGCTQTYGIDYTKIFAPIAKINTVRILLSLAANLDWSLQQFNVKNVFLHGELSEEVYIDLGVRKATSEVTGNDPEERKALQNYLSREFKMKDLGHLKYFLGIEVSRSSEGIFLSQIKYVLDLLQKTGMSGCQPVNTPIEEGLKLCVEPNQVSTDKGRYQRLVGRLMYLAHTRPDLAYALSVVSQYMYNLGEQHMNAVMRILRYLKNAPRKGILFAKNVDHQSIKAYTDVDWVGTMDDRRSTSGYLPL